MKGMSGVPTYVPFSIQNLKGEALGGCFLFPRKWKYVGRTSKLKCMLTFLIAYCKVRKKINVTNLNDK